MGHSPAVEQVSQTPAMPAPPPTICIVDDDPAIRRALRRLLVVAGFRVELFPSAEEFLSGKPAACDCLVLDVRMPGMSGLCLQECLARSNGRLPIVFITAHDDDVTRTRAMAGGAVALLRKPFEDRALLDAIATAVASRNPPGD